MKKWNRNGIINHLLSDEVILATVSGVVTTNPALIEYVDREVPAVFLITTKSIQVKPNKGNREPIICEPEEGSYGNAVGLKNPGMEPFLEEMKELRERVSIRSIINVSLAGDSAETFSLLAKTLEPVADMFELNVSCPHTGSEYGAAIGVDPFLVAEIVAAVKKVTTLLVFPKLTPQAADIPETVRLSLEAGADGFAAINTVGPEVYYETTSGAPILSNPIDHKGGKSGRWIRERALEVVREVRETAGPDIPIIGMGGIETSGDIEEMKKAGANAFGLGSVFGKVRQRNWKAFTDALTHSSIEPLKMQATGSTKSASSYLTNGRQMEYRPFRIIRVEDLPGSMKMLTLDGSLSSDPSEYVFLWMPGFGEKPFSIAGTDPLRFIIKDRGKLTEELVNLKVGDQIFLRGPYGRKAPGTEMQEVFLLGGGTGIAVLPELAASFAAEGKDVRVFIGITESGAIDTAELFPAFNKKEVAQVTVVPDNGEVGKVIGVLKEVLKRQQAPEGGQALYAIGPVPFMKGTAEVAEAAGINPCEIYLSVEKETRCGVGICGECSCGGVLTCSEGTFFSWSWLKERGEPDEGNN